VGEKESGRGGRVLWGSAGREKVLEPEPRLPQVGTDPYGTNAALDRNRGSETCIARITPRPRITHRIPHRINRRITPRILLAQAGWELLFLTVSMGDHR